MISKLRLRFRRKKKEIPTTVITNNNNNNNNNIDDGNTSVESFQRRKRKNSMDKNAKKKSKGKKKKSTHRTPYEILLERKVAELKRELRVSREDWSSSRHELELRLGRAKRTIIRQEQILMQQRKTITNTELLDSTKIEKKYLQEKMQTRVLSEQQSKLTLQKQGLIEQRAELLAKIETQTKEIETLKNLLKTHNISCDSESSEISPVPSSLELSSSVTTPTSNSSPEINANFAVELEIEKSMRDTASPILQVSPRDISSLRHKKLSPSLSFFYIPLPPSHPPKFEKQKNSHVSIKLVKLKTKKWDCLNSKDLLNELEMAQYEKLKKMFLDEKNTTKALSPQS